jgi:hypothetical protein
MTLQLCDRCGRVPVVQDRSAYSVERGKLIVRHGFCACPPATASEAPAAAVRTEREPEPVAPLPQPVVEDALESAGARHGR